MDPFYSVRLPPFPSFCLPSISGVTGVHRSCMIFPTTSIPSLTRILFTCPVCYYAAACRYFWTYFSSYQAALTRDISFLFLSLLRVSRMGSSCRRRPAGGVPGQAATGHSGDRPGGGADLHLQRSQRPAAGGGKRATLLMSVLQHLTFHLLLMAYFLMCTVL